MDLASEAPSVLVRCRLSEIERDDLENAGPFRLVSEDRFKRLFRLVAGEENSTTRSMERSWMQPSKHAAKPVHLGRKPLSSRLRPGLGDGYDDVSASKGGGRLERREQQA